MFIKKMKFLILFFSMISSNLSYAFFYVEPYMMFNVAAFGEEIQANSFPKEYEYNTLIYGGRGGLSLLGFDFGADLSQGLSVVEVKTFTSVGESTSRTLKHEKEDLGVFVGYRFETLRLWHTQLVSAKLTQKQGGDRIVHSGTGQVYGLGAISSTGLTLNIELRRLNYKYEKSTSSSEDPDDKYSPLKITEISVGISWIIDIF
jgi:hypothetical protein